MTTEVPLLITAPRPPMTESSVAAPKRLKKWLSTSPDRPERPEYSTAGDASATDTPSGRINRVHMT
jgi:hypothetical protein